MKRIFLVTTLLSGLIQASTHATESEKIRLAIIGSGPAGYTAALYAARANLHPHLFEGERNGQLAKTHSIKNWTGVQESTGADLMDTMHAHTSSSEYKIEKHQEFISDVSLNNSPFELKTKEGKVYSADAVIIATGAQPKRLGLPSEEIFWGRGVTSCSVCDGPLAKDKDVVVVGGGSTAVEDAIYLSGLAKKVHLVHRRGKESLKAEEVLQKQLFQLIKEGKVVPHWNREINEVLGDQLGVTSVTLKENGKQTNETLKAHSVFIAIGYIPNTSLFDGKLDMTKNNYLKVDGGQGGNATHTSVPGVFAAGDVMDPIYQQAIVAAGAGARAAMDAQQYLMKHKS